MKQKKYTITAATLNVGDAIETDVTITNEASVNTPASVLFVNSSGVEIGYVYLSNDTEKADFVANPTNYVYIPLASSRSTSALAMTKYIMIKLITGVATGDLDFYTSGYGRY